MNLSTRDGKHFIDGQDYEILHGLRRSNNNACAYMKRYITIGILLLNIFLTSSLCLAGPSSESLEWKEKTSGALSYPYQVEAPYTDNGDGTISLNISTPDLSPYWKSDGTSTATGNWSLGSYGLTTTGTITATSDNIKLHPAVTYTIASSTSRGKNEADYVCDGIADDVQIQAALDALPTTANSGGKIILLEGTFSLSDTVLLRQGDGNRTVVIEGQGGWGTVLKLSDNINKDMFQTTGIVANKMLTVIFRDFVANGNYANNLTAGRFYYNTSTDSSAHGDILFDTLFLVNFRNDVIDTSSAWNFNMVDSIIESGQARGVVIQGGRGDWNILNSTFNFMVNANIALSGTPTDLGATIIGNAFNNSSTANNDIVTISAPGCVISNNILYIKNPASSRKAIHITSDNNIISNNIVVTKEASAGSGITLDVGADYNMGTANRIALGGGATTFISDSGANNSIQINGTFGDGGVTNYSNFDADGDLVFNGTTNYLVAGDRYVFRYSVDEDAGLYLNATSTRYELRDTLAAANWYATLAGATVQASTVTATQLISNIATGTAPLTVTSTTKVTNLNADKVDGIDGFGYTLQGSSDAVLATANDATTYYFGTPYDAGLTTTAAVQGIYIPKTGTIKAIYVHFLNAGTLSTTETSTISVRLNNTTDTVISSSVTNDALVTTFNNTALSIAVSAGDYIEFKWVTPTWVTNPTTVRASAVVYIE